MIDSNFTLDLFRDQPFSLLQFEKECKRLEIPLIVLPQDVRIQRGRARQSHLPEEFYNKNNLLANNITEMRIELEKAIWECNHYRPHAHLNESTPMLYIQANCSFWVVSLLVN